MKIVSTFKHQNGPNKHMELLPNSLISNPSNSRKNTTTITTKPNFSDFMHRLKTSPNLRFMLISFACFFVTENIVQANVIDLNSKWKINWTEEKKDLVTKNTKPKKNKKKSSPVNKGKANGWEKVEFNDSDWKTIIVGSTWEEQGINKNGIAWYRKSVTIPEKWKGSSIVFSGGKPDDGGEVYFNGKSLGSFSFKQNIMVSIPNVIVNWNSKNVIAVRVWDWYKSGGLRSGNYKLERLQPFIYSKPESKIPIKLKLTTDLKDEVFQQGRWEHGLELIGTDDQTRIKLLKKRGAYKGEDAIEFTIRNPNSKQYVDYILDQSEKGDKWSTEKLDYISFWYKTENLRGDISIALNKGRLKSGKKTPSASTYIPVKPGDWTRVILPFSQFLFRYNSFKSRVLDEREPLINPSFIDSIGLGYENNRLQGKGSIMFANFKVGKFSKKGLITGIQLSGLWRFCKDNIRPDGKKSVFGKKGEEKINAIDRAGYGRELGYFQENFDDKNWGIAKVPGFWGEQGQSYKGPAWYRQEVIIPGAWTGKDLALHLGTPATHGELYWNGKLLMKVEDDSQHPFFAIVPTSEIKFGEKNNIALRVESWRPRRAGIDIGRFEIIPKAASSILFAESGSNNAFVHAEKFEIGSKPGKNVSVKVSFASSNERNNPLNATIRMRDCYFRRITEKEVRLTQESKRTWHAQFKLTKNESEQLFYSEFFSMKILLQDKTETPVAGLYNPVLKLQYNERDNLSLPPLLEKYEETPFGKLKLVDYIDCSLDPAEQDNPYKEGGIRASWVGTQAYSSWVNGINVNEYSGKSYREASNNQYFGYRLGRKLKPHTPYLIRLLVPEDKIRYSNIEFKAGRNFQGVGYRNGISPDHPHFSYPLKGGYKWVDTLIINDDSGYGFKGSRSVSSENGFWVFFYDIGRCYAGAYEEGPAVSEIRMYEITEPENSFPIIHYPKGEKQRILMTDWERQPEQPPKDVVTWAKLVGLNSLSPVIQKWSFHGFWHSKLGFAPPGWYTVAPDGEDDRDTLQKWLKATKEGKINFIPRVEYGGSKTLPEGARVINKKGVVDECGRFCNWGANILDERTLGEYKTLIDEIIGSNFKNNPQLSGLLWRLRSERIRCSFGEKDVALFCKEMGHKIPTGNAKRIAQWASGKMRVEYIKWWQKKKIAFLTNVRDHMKKYDPKMALLFYNWDEDGWAKFGTAKGCQNKGMPHNTVGPKEWGKFYNVKESRTHQMSKFPERISGEKYVEMLRSEGGPHKNIFPELLKNEKDIHVFSPVHREDIADSAEYHQYFKTASGYSFCNIFDYEERARWNVQGDNHEGSMIGPGNSDFAMAYEVLSCFHGDPNVITWTTYTMGRTFVSEIRKFAKAFLALPAIEGNVMKDAILPFNKDAKVRMYEGVNANYIGLVYRGINSSVLKISVPAQSATRVINQVTGKKENVVLEGGKIMWEVKTTPMSLYAYKLE